MASMAEVSCLDDNGVNGSECLTGMVLSEETKQLVQEWLELDEVRLGISLKYNIHAISAKPF